MEPETTQTDSSPSVEDLLLEREKDRQSAIDAEITEAEKIVADHKDVEFKDQLDSIQDQPRIDNKVDSLGEYVQEAGAIVGGGFTQGVEDVITLPEKLIDIINGEYAREEMEGGYRPDFNPFHNYQHAEARTKLGKIAQSLVSTGTTFAATGGALGLAGKGISAATKGTALARALTKATTGSIFDGSRLAYSIAGPKIGGNYILPLSLQATRGTIAKGIAKGVLTDIAKPELSSGDNLAKMLSDQVPQVKGLLSPLAVAEGDHPNLVLLKNVLEGATLGLVFDSLSVSRAGLRGIANSKRAWNSVTEQTIGRAKTALKNTEFNGFKNKTIADHGQGQATSTGTLKENLDALDKIDLTPGLGQGSVKGLMSSADVHSLAQGSGLDEEVFQKFYRELVGGPTYEADRKLWAAQGLSPQQVRSSSLRRMQEMVGSRDWTELSTEEFWEPMFRNLETVPGTDVYKWNPDHIATAEALNYALLKKLRDQAMSARELVDSTNILDKDGPMHGIAEKLIVGLTNTNKYKYIISNQMDQLKKPLTARDVSSATASFNQEARATVQAFMDQVKGDTSGDLLQATIEAFSMSNHLRNVEDLNAFMRAKLRGGEFGGKANTAAWINEMQGVMVHSILSGPKTPIRAVMGTSSASFLRPISTALGHAMRGDGDAVRASLAATNAYIESVPEAWKLFKNRLNSYMSGDLSNVKTRYAEYNKRDDNWELMRQWAEGPTATDGDKAAFYVANLARGLNDNSLLTYSTKMMAATDDSFRYLMARSRAREKAMKLAMDNNKVGAVTEITPQLLKDYENNFLKDLIDESGNIDTSKDMFLEAAAKEATLTTDLTGFSAGLEELFNRTPLVKPFFLFARTGINGLAMGAKNTPLLNYALKSQRDIFSAKSWSPSLIKYGIENADDLANAKALAMGRQAIGGSVIFIAGQHFMNGNLTGNGPADVSKRQFMMDSGWKPRSFRIGDVWVSYESMEPFNQVLSMVADIGDNMKLMGPEWAEMNLARAALIVGQNAGSKTYMSSLSQLIDLLSGKPHQAQKILGGIANNALPLAGMRNEVGKLLNPGMRELGSNIGDTIRNRNLLFEYGPGSDLPKKYDILNGQPIKDWWFPHQLWEAVVPISISLSQSPGRTLLFNSNYDSRVSTMTAPDGTDLTDQPEIRSRFQQALGNQGLEKELNRLAKLPSIQSSVAQMEKDLQDGRRDIDPSKAYNHNIRIRGLFRRARTKAWASLRNDPDVQALINRRKSAERDHNIRKKVTSPLSVDYQNILKLQPK